VLSKESRASLTCKETIAVLSDYLGALCGPDVIERLEAHLRDCAPCRAYLATFRRTRELTKTVGRVEMPPEMKARLRQFLLGQLSTATDESAGSPDIA
jgi:predicted anti-sigma-YlaC factor YlaD